MKPASFPLEKAVEAVRSRLHGTPEVFVVLGSGLSGLADGVSGGVSIPFREVPGFPEPTVPGHTGRLVFGEVEGKKVLLQAGRFHFYEGHNSDVVVAPVRMAAGLGVRSVLLTNAAGSVSSGLVTGSIMMIEDHVNFMARSPLAGPVLEGEQRFPDMSQPYDATLRGVAREAARELGIDLPEGVYAAVLGPSYETPAEIRLLRGVGADAVGMSTVPEAIAARASGLRVLAFSVITNQAAGLSKDPLNHDEVLEMGKVSGGRLEKLLRVILGKM